MITKTTKTAGTWESDYQLHLKTSTTRTNTFINTLSLKPEGLLSCLVTVYFVVPFQTSLWPIKGESFPTPYI